MFGKNFKPIKKFFQNSEKFPNIFETFPKDLKKFPNFLGIFLKGGKISKYIQIFYKQLTVETLCNYLDKKCLET